MNTYSLSPLTLAISIALMGMGVSSTFAQAVSAVPEGFEELLLGQHEQVDVLFLGESLGLYSALVKPDTVQFDQADVLVQQLVDRKKIKSEYANPLKSAFATSLMRNGHRQCFGTASVNGCGYIETDGVAIIFDERRNAIELFVNPNWITSKPESARHYTLSPQSQNAFIHRQTLNWSSSEQYSNASLSGTGALGMGERRYLAGNWNSIWTQSQNSNKPQFNLQDLYLRQDLGATHYAQAGMMDQRNLASSLGGNFNFSLLPMPLFRGIRVGTTQAYVNQSVASQQDDATPITLILNRQSRVEIYRGEQLLTTQYVDAGMQNLNSDSLPTGSYLLSLRIYENGELTRSESVPFSKTGSGLGSAETEWFMQGGRIKDNQNLKGTSWQTGVRARMLRSMVITSGISGLNSQLFNETRADWQTQLSRSSLSISSSWLTGQNHVRGNSQQITYANSSSVSLYRYQQRGSQCNGGEMRNDNLGCYDALSASASSVIAGWTGTIGHTRSQTRGYRSSQYDSNNFYIAAPVRQQQMTSQSATQISFSRSFTLHDLSLTSRFGVYQSSNNSSSKDTGGFIGFSMSYIRRPPSTATRNSQTSAGMEYRSSRNGGTKSNWNVQHSESNQAEHYREASFAVQGEGSKNLGLAVGGRSEGRYGTLNATYAMSQPENGKMINAMSGTWSSSLVTDGRGVWLGNSGNDGNPSAATLVSVHSNQDVAQGPAIEVHYLGRPLTLDIGQSVAVLSDGYQNSQSDIRESTTTKNSLFSQLGTSSGIRKEFLTPGHLTRREVNAKITWTWVGRAMFKDQPLPLADIINLSNERLDEQGAFMVETFIPMTMLYLSHHDTLFSCQLTVREKRDVLRVVGETQCSEIEFSKLPFALKSERRINAQRARN